MRKPRAIAIALCALLTLAPTNPMFAIETMARKATPAASTVPKNPLSSPTCGPEMQAGVWQQTPAGDRRVRKLEGPAADAFLEKLRAGNPRWRNMHSAAVAALTAKGFKPAIGIEGETVVLQVEKLKRNGAVVKPPSVLARLTNFFMPAVHAAQSDALYTAEGVIWTSSWDDGDPATWEGVLGVHEYSYGNYGEGGAQLRNDIEDEGAGVPWTSGGVTQPGTFTSAEAYNKGIRRVFGCSIGTCIGALGRCIFGGPFTMNCLLLWCGVGVATCVFSTYIQMAIDGEVPCGPRSPGHNNC
jgi:hypothetical protein